MMTSEEVPLLHRSKTAYYDILKVSPSATQSQIKTAYYKQSFIYHPDKNLGRQDATQRFSQISEAYTVLGNISLRRKYDRGILSQSDLQSSGKPSSRYPSTVHLEDIVPCSDSKQFYISSQIGRCLIVLTMEDVRQISQGPILGSGPTPNTQRMCLGPLGQSAGVHQDLVYPRE
uniref:DnaJ heat shock protein family (Hsp40) member C30 n=1 Tax=Fundulus heteroclitus TaxID=8078 RepID=A0A3Q2PNG2_FUNHE